jgi:putative ABC transport system permease protein
MFGTYLRRELANRRRQTIIIAIGMALAIALVIVVNAAAGGVKSAQATALQSVYGVGTDLTVTKTTTAAATNGGQQRFNFGSGAGNTSGGKRTFASSRLAVDQGTTAFASSVLTTVQKTADVKSATGVLSLRQTSFTGSVPSRTQGTTGGQRSTGGQAAGGGTASGPSNFGVNAFTVLGYDVKGATIGPLTAATLTKGRTLTAADAGTDVALLDSNYATSAKKAVGGTVTIASKSFKIVGIVKSTSSSGASASNVYIPLDTAQKLSTDTNKLSSVYIEAASSTDITAVQASLKKSLGSTMTVNSESDLASSVSGSISTASSLANSLGLWLSVLVLVAAFLIAVLFTISGVTRRTREFGTLKAIGWSNRRIVGQVAGESFVQGLIGGVIGIVVGVAAIVVVNLLHVTLTASATASRFTFGGGGAAGGAGGAAAGAAGAAGGFAGGEGGGGFGRAAANAATTAASNIALTLPVSASVILIAVGLAVLGGLIAGAFGGWRAARLRPAEALRSVA